MRMLTINEIAALAGGIGKLAEIAGVDHSTVIWWRRNGDRVPKVERALRIHKHLGVPLHMLRPDIWQAEKETAS